MEGKMVDGAAAYRVGALLYTPAERADIAKKILENEIPLLTSVALCLEDATSDADLLRAESQLLKTLSELSKRGSLDSMPMTFVRVRNPEHLIAIAGQLSEHCLSVTGFILPKFDLSNAVDYMNVADSLPNVWRDRPYVMPILETRAIADPHNRRDELSSIKQILDEKKDWILNVRVGGNDLCSLYGIRRSWDQNIYQIGPVRDALVDIVATFGADYVVSGPVWDYFGTGHESKWKEGLEAELRLDKLNGFIGKTAIHPCQVPVIAESLKVEKLDLEDALTILGRGEGCAVSKSHSGVRMDEAKTHTRWAQRTVDLAKVFGVKDRA